MEILPVTPGNVVRAAAALKAGEVVAYPTETVYGLGVDPLNDAALDRLFEVKQRDPANPVLLIVSSPAQLDAISPALSPRAARLANAFWPGPLSMLLPCHARVPARVRGPDGRICVRWTSSSTAQALCQAFGGAVVSTSANLSGRPPATRADDVPRDGVALCLDGGELPPGPVSTVVDPETGRVLREGAIGAEAIARVLGGDCG